MQLSKTEQMKLIENVKSIFNYLKTEIVPKIERNIEYTFPGNFKIVIHPDEKRCFTITQADSKRVFVLSNDINSFVSEEDSTNTMIMNKIDYNNELMLNILKTWNELKIICTRAVSEDAQLRKLIDEFKI